MAQTIYYVKPTASGNGSGLGGWNNATNSLPTALSTAQDGDQIWIAAGLYKPTSTTVRAERFVINRNLTVYGGFVGTESSPASRTITGFSSTTLSGDIGQVGVASDNSYRVVDMPVNNLSVVLDGLVIRDGNATPESGLPSNLEAAYSNGGGVYCRYSSLTLVSCLITANQAGGLGAGAYMDAVDLRMISSQFTSNTTITGGGGINSIIGSVSATASLFADNIGGFYQPGVAGGGQGGGISLMSTPARFDRCTFQNNFAHNGGAINVQNIPATLTNCLFTDNRSPFGAVIYSPGGVSFVNCTMARNQNQDTPGHIVAALWGSGSLTNCVVWGNNTNNQSPFPYGPFTMTNSLVQGIGPDPANGNLDGTNANLTVFVDLANANYTLQTGSPTIDAGRTSANTTALDLAGQNRVMGCGIDMGALELVQTGSPVSVSLASASTTICIGQPITLTAVSQGGSAPYSYTWAVGAGGQPGSPTNTSIVSVMSTSVGPLSVTVSVSNADGCTATRSSTFTVIGTIAQPLTNTVVCFGSTVRAVLSTTGTVSGYQWFKGTTALNGQNSATLTLANVQPGDAGDYSVRVSTPCANTLSIPFSLTVEQPITTLIASSLTFCSGSVTLTAGTGGNNYTFNGPGLSQSGTSTTATVTQGGTFSVLVTSSNGCTASASTTITLLSGGVSLGAILAGGGFCEGSLVQLVVPVTGSPHTLRWYWNPAGMGQAPQLVSGQNSATLTLTNVQDGQAGRYVLVATANCNSVTSTAYNLVVGTVQPSITIALPDASTVVVSGQTPLVTLPQGSSVPVQVTGGVFYEWLTIIDRLNGYEIRQVDQNTTGLFTLNRPGPYRLTVTNAGGCSRTVEGIIQMRP